MALEEGVAAPEAKVEMEVAAEDVVATAPVAAEAMATATSEEGLAMGATWAALVAAVQRAPASTDVCADPIVRTTPQIFGCTWAKPASRSAADNIS